jgi:hypothetical protein
MAIYSNTRQQLRHLVADICDDIITGTVTSPGSGTFVCAETDWQRSDDHFNDWREMFCYSGPGVGTSGKPTDWDAATWMLTFAPAVTLTAGDLVEMHQKFTVAQYNRMINLAIDMVAKEAFVYKVDTSTVVVASTYSYTLPTEFLTIMEIEQESATSGVYDGTGIIDLRAIKIIPGTTAKFEIDPDYFTPTADRKLRIKGMASPSILDTDSEECPIDPQYVTFQAAALLMQSRMRGQNAADQYQVQRWETYQNMAGYARAHLLTTPLQGISVIE